MSSQTTRAHLALMAVSSIYGYFYVAVKLLYKTLTPPEFILLRLVLTAFFVILIDRCLLKHPTPQREDWVQIGGLGLVGVFVVQTLIAWGVHHTTTFHTALIMSTIPIMTLILSILGRREKFHLYKLGGIVTAFAGVIILLFFSENTQAELPETYLWGDSIILLNAVAFSWFLLGSQQMLQKYNSFQFMAYCYIISALVFASLFVGQSLLSGHLEALLFFQKMTVTDWMLLGYVVFFASIGSYTLNNYALRRVNPSVVAIYMFIQPIISAVTGFYLLHEPLNLQMVAASMLSFAGVLMTTGASQKEKAQQRVESALQTTSTAEPSSASVD